MTAAPPLARARRAGNLVFVSGQLARGEDGRIVEGDITAQARQALANLTQVLAEHDCAPIHVMKVTAWLTDSAHAGTFNAVYRDVFGPPYPARSTVVSALLAPGALVEVEAIALRP